MINRAEQERDRKASKAMRDLADIRSMVDGALQDVAVVETYWPAGKRGSRAGKAWSSLVARLTEMQKTLQET